MTCVLGPVPISALAQGYPAEEAAGKMTLAPGFEAVLFASEPVITQPVCIEFDDRGRLWCVQYQQYPNPSGLKRVSVDRWSRTKYDRVPPPPPHGPRGNDAITILEDTNGDGRADAHKHFVEGLNLCSGVAFGFGGVFVLQVPYLLFYADEDRDDVPDSDPAVLLEGFGMEDAHSVANSLTWGPDGWLYGTQGSTVTSNIRGIEFQQGVWRYHVQTARFELFAEGGGNMWGLDFNEVGDCFASTNLGPHILLHAQQGAYYWKSFGKHGGLHNPYAYGYFEHATHHNAQGGHVTDGGIVYQGGAYPPAFNGKYIANNLLSHAIYFHDLLPVGSTYETRHAGTLLDANDRSFAPSDLTVGPDGFLYVADWNDQRTAHPDPDAEWDRATGRIYQIRHGAPRQMDAFDLRTKSAEELIALLEHPNYWFRRRARVLLAEKKDPGGGAVLQRLAANRERPLAGRLEALWALFGTSETDEAFLKSLLRDSEPAVRRWAVCLLGDTRQGPPEKGMPYDDLPMKVAASETDARVQAQLACTAQRLDRGFAWRVLQGLAKNDAANDPRLPLLLWWAIETHALERIDATIANVARERVWRRPQFAAVLMPNLVRRFAADNSPGYGDLGVLEVLETAPTDDDLAMLLAGLDRGLQERGQGLIGVQQGGLFESSADREGPAPSAAAAKPVDPELVAAIARLHAEIPGDLLRLRLAVRVGHAPAYAAAKQRAMEGPDRAEAIKILAQFGQDDCIDLLFGVLREDADAALRLEALAALRRFSTGDIGARLLSVYADADATLRAKLREAMLAKAAWAGALLAAVDSGAIDAKDIAREELRVVASHKDDALTALVEKHWGKIRAGTPEEKLAEMRRLNNELNFAAGDPEKGKQVFKDTCMKCHTLHGEGGKVGPDLTQANRKDREFLLQSLVDPSAAVDKEFRQFTITTRSFDVYNGVLGPREAGKVVVFNADAQPITVPEEEIDTMEELDLSLMPEDLLKPLHGDAVRDLFAYLQQGAAAK